MPDRERIDHHKHRRHRRKQRSPFRKKEKPHLLTRQSPAPYRAVDGSNASGASRRSGHHHTHTHPTESGETKRSDRKQSALLSRQTHRDASGDREHARPQQSTTRSESVDSNLQRAPKQNTRPPAHPSRTPRHNCAVLLALRNRRISAAVLLHHHMSKPSSHVAAGEGSRSRVGREGRSSRGALLSRELVALFRSDLPQMLRKLGCDDGFM